MLSKSVPSYFPNSTLSNSSYSGILFLFEFLLLCAFGVASCLLRLRVTRNLIIIIRVSFSNNPPSLTSVFFLIWFLTLWFFGTPHSDFLLLINFISFYSAFLLISSSLSEYLLSLTASHLGLIFFGVSSNLHLSSLFKLSAILFRNSILIRIPS
jgi:hypothetical protein